MWIVHLWWWIQYHIGMTDGGGRPYLFWSGAGSDFTELAILGGLIQIFRQHNCGVKGCYRIGHHEVKGTHMKTCHKHATISHHKKLQQDHKNKFPKQHELLGKR